MSLREKNRTQRMTWWVSNFVQQLFKMLQLGAVVVTQVVEQRHSARVSRFRNPDRLGVFQKCYQSNLTRRRAISKTVHTLPSSFLFPII